MTAKTEFILARLTEHEADARTAVIEAHDGHRPHPELAEWEYAQHHQQWRIQVVGSASGDDWPLTVTHDQEGLSDSVADWAGPHIARNDPHRVLRWVGALRAIVAIWDADAVQARDWDNGGAPTGGVIGGQGPETHDEALTHLAWIWADHPDYDPAWAAQ